MKHCFQCVRKHLSQAMIIHEEEVPMGYPDHIDRVVGHLAEASREAVKKAPDLAGVIRDQRLRVMDDPEYYPPYQDMITHARVLLVCEDQELPFPELPDVLKAPVVKPA